MVRDRGLGQEKESEAVLESYEDEVGQDIVARALFRELQEERENSQDGKSVTEAFRLLHQEVEDKEPKA